MKWSLAKFVLLLTAAAVAVGPVRGQKYRDELQRDGVQPAKITLHSCERAFKHAPFAHIVLEERAFEADHWHRGQARPMVHEAD